MRTRKKLFYLPLIFIAAFIALIYIIFTLPPDHKLLLGSFQIPILPLGLLLFFVFIWSLVAFIFTSKIQGLIVAAIPTIYLILRLNKLDQMFFVVLLILIFAGLELLFFRKH